MSRPAWLVLILLVLLAAAAIVAWRAARDEPQIEARLVVLPASGPPAGYERATGPRPLSFPADFGPHPGYQVEWWYYTGNLQAAGGQHLGYQLTFFRRALQPPAQRVDRASAWAADQAYMAHLALTDVAGRRHSAFERLARGAAGLAGAQASPYRVWLEDWSVEEDAAGRVRLRAAAHQGGVALDLLLEDGKGPVLQGDRGYSRKGPQPGNASYYYSQTRLETTGTLQVEGDAYPVRGLSWMDHEWSTSSLSAGQVGWDWFSVQLDDGSELMLFQLRREDGGVDPFSSGTFVAADGSTRSLARDDFRLDVTATWRSPETGALYPAGWTLAVPGLDLHLTLAPHLADQELVVSYAYWEGAVRVEGQRAGRPVRGHGYAELTGYAGSMEGQF